MNIIFREFNPFDLWIWLEFSANPSRIEQQYIEELFASWFYLGKLGGFNAENLQVQENGVDISHMDYDIESANNTLMSVMHNMSDFEYQGNWARCWFDIGTSDLISLDVLLNSLNQINKDILDIKQILIGGENEHWPINSQEDSIYN
jgi:hypothetical protein